MPMRTMPGLLAVAATVTAAFLSVHSGPQRGGLPAERALWITVGVVLVVGTHLLPPLPSAWMTRARRRRPALDSIRKWLRLT